MGDEDVEEREGEKRRCIGKERRIKRNRDGKIKEQRDGDKETDG